MHYPCPFRTYVHTYTHTNLATQDTDRQRPQGTLAAPPDRQHRITARLRSTPGVTWAAAERSDKGFPSSANSTPYAACRSGASTLPQPQRSEIT